jgi:hypothetical protein
VIAGVEEDIIQNLERITELQAIQKATDRGLPEAVPDGYPTCKLVNEDESMWTMLHPGNTHELCLVATSKWGCQTYGVAQPVIEQRERWERRVIRVRAYPPRQEMEEIDFYVQVGGDVQSLKAPAGMEKQEV